MSIGAIRTITRREISDTVTDWRILAPMFILAFILPLVLVSAANFAIRFIADNNTVPLLVPFVMLLVGFIPASFSLITALETFVGERERNSLEALLAKIPSDASPETITSTIRDAVTQFAAGTEPADDLAILILRWDGPPTPE